VTGARTATYAFCALLTPPTRSAERTRIPIKATAAREGHPPSKCVASAQYCRTPAIPPAANSPTPPYKSAPAFVSSTSPLLLLLPPAVNCRFALNFFCTRWSELAYFSIHKEIQRRRLLQHYRLHCCGGDPITCNIASQNQQRQRGEGDGRAWY
jgi:hypothetical protein